MKSFDRWWHQPMRFWLRVCSTILLLSVAASAWGGEKLTYLDLVRRLTERTRNAVLARRIADAMRAYGGAAGAASAIEERFG